MRWWLVGCLMLVAVPADAALTVTAAAPEAPVPLDGSAKLTLTVQVDCLDLPPRALDLDLRIAVAAPDLTLEGPATLRANLLECSGLPPTWTGSADYAIHGSRYLPGLVAIAGNASAALAPAAHPLLEVAPANASFQVVPAAILEDEFAPLQVPPTASSGALDIPVGLVSRGNVDVRLQLTWAGKESLSHDGGMPASLALPRGALALPGTLLLPRATGDAAPGKAAVGLMFMGAAGHAGVDRFHLVAQGAALLDPALATRSEALLEVPYDLREPAGKGTTAPAGRVGAELAPISSRAAPAVGMALLALLAACALAARSRPGRRA